MPQKGGVLNALARLRASFALVPAAGARLDPQAFLAHAARLAAAEPPTPGLWLSWVTDRPPAALPAVAAWVRPEALGGARAPFVAFAPAEGRLAPFALERIAAALAARPDAAALYTDEVYADARGRPAEIVLKPAFDPVWLDSANYFGRLAVYRRDLVGAGLEPHALARRAAGAGPVLHLPYPAFVGPPPAASAAPAPRPAPEVWPRIDVVIPSRDAPDLIAEALDGLYARTDYPDFGVIVVDNGSTDPRTLALYETYARRGLRVERRAEAFNFSRAVNRGAALGDAPLILLLNNDIVVRDPGWLKEMASCLAYPDAGIVGAKLLYPDGTLQHAGVIAGLGGYAGHWHIGEPEATPGPGGRLAARHTLSVVTGACMLVSRACFEALGGFDEATFPIAYNDVDFCLRAGAAGFRTIYTPFACLIHAESATRGSDETPENLARFARDKAALVARHRTEVLEDRAYNPWAARTHSAPFAVARATLPRARV